MIELTRIEFELLRYLSQGFTRKQIAEARYVAVSTVKTQLATLYAKLNVSTATEAVSIAYESGIFKQTLLMSDLNLIDMYKAPDKVLLPEHYQKALAAQEGNNSAGLISELNEISQVLIEEANSRNAGIAFINSHPIFRLYFDRLTQLCGAYNNSFGSFVKDIYNSGMPFDTAYQICKEKAAK